MKEFEGFEPNRHYSDKGSHKYSSDYHKALRQLRQKSGEDIPMRGILFLGTPVQLEQTIREEIQAHEDNPTEASEH